MKKENKKLFVFIILLSILAVPFGVHASPYPHKEYWTTTAVLVKQNTQETDTFSKNT